jgi:hypothetical protein
VALDVGREDDLCHYRMTGSPAVADMTGLPTLRTVSCAVGRSVCARHAVLPSMTRVIALASATTTILQWVRRSALIREEDIFGLPA